MKDQRLRFENIPSLPAGGVRIRDENRYTRGKDWVTSLPGLDLGRI